MNNRIVFIGSGSMLFLGLDFFGEQTGIRMFTGGRGIDDHLTNEENIKLRALCETLPCTYYDLLCEYEHYCLKLQMLEIEAQRQKDKDKWKGITIFIYEMKRVPNTLIDFDQKNWDKKQIKHK